MTEREKENATVSVIDKDEHNYDDDDEFSNTKQITWKYATLYGWIKCR